MSHPGSIQPDGHPGAFETLILGIGNVLYADEGFGVRAVEALNAQYVFKDDVRVMDGGTQGILLLPWVCSARRLLIFDAVDFGMAPATLRLVRGSDVPCFMGAKKVSMHQAGFQEVLASADLTGALPSELALVGVQPVRLDDFGGSLRPQVRERIPEALECARSVLAEWGVAMQPRTAPLETVELVGPRALGLDNYEMGRP